MTPINNGNNVFYLIFFTLILVLNIFYACGSLCIIEKIYNNTNIMVKKLNKKHCSHCLLASLEQCFLFNFFYHNFSIIYFLCMWLLVRY